MDFARLNKAIANASGLTQAEVTHYFSEAHHRSDGSMVIFFAHDFRHNREVARKLEHCRSLVIPAAVATIIGAAR